MGQPILTRVSLGLNAGNDGNPTDIYYFLAPKGVYTGDIATTTGISEPETPGLFDNEVLSNIKELVRGEVLNTSKVIVFDATNNVTWFKTLHYSPDKTSFKADIKGKLWPVGKGAQVAIAGTMTSVRIKSRQ